MLVETRPDIAANQLPHYGERVGEERPVRLHLIIAAQIVVVAEREEDRLGGKCLLEPLRQKLHRLMHEDAIGGVRVIAGRGVKLAAEIMGEKIARHEHEGRVRQCLSHLPEG
jgi:hypothetical protein